MKKLILLLCIVSHIVPVSAMDESMWLDMFGKLSSSSNNTLNQQLIENIFKAAPAENIIQLLQKGANSTAVLAVAVSRGLPKYTQLLLDNLVQDANAYLCDYVRRKKGKDSLVTLAIMNDDSETLAILLRHGIPPDVSAFRQAARYNRVPHLRLLIEYGMNVDTELDDDKNTALIEFSTKSVMGYAYNTIIEALIEYGANINHQNKQGDTALIALSQIPSDWQSCVIKRLLAFGANPYLCNNEGKTAQDYAQTPKLKELIQAGIAAYRCVICFEHVNKYLKLLPCLNKHLETFICDVCCNSIKTQTNLCPLCRNQLS